MSDYKVNLVIKERVGNHWGKVDIIETTPEKAVKILSDKYVSRKLSKMYDIVTEGIERALK